MVNCRKPRTEVPVAENNPQINCQSTQLQVYGKVLFKTVQEKAVKEIYNLFSWAYISLYFWQAVMENRLPARSYSPDCWSSNLLSASLCSFNIQSILWCWLVQWPRHAWSSLRILTTVLFLTGPSLSISPVFLASGPWYEKAQRYEWAVVLPLVASGTRMVFEIGFHKRNWGENNREGTGE